MCAFATFFPRDYFLISFHFCFAFKNPTESYDSIQHFRIASIGLAWPSEWVFLFLGKWVTRGHRFAFVSPARTSISSFATFNAFIFLIASTATLNCWCLFNCGKKNVSHPPIAHCSDNNLIQNVYRQSFRNVYGLQNPPGYSIENHSTVPRR